MPSRIEGFDHVTVVVTDLREAKHFFELLGFAQTQAVVVSGEEMSSYMGIPDWEADHVTMVLQGVAPRQEVQLLRFHRPASILDPQAGNLARSGFNHLCFRVRDLSGLLAHLNEHGISARNEMMTFHDRRLVFLAGPAGLTVELAEWMNPPSP